MRVKDLVIVLQYAIEMWDSEDYQVMTHNEDGELVAAVSIVQDHNTNELHISDT